MTSFIIQIPSEPQKLKKGLITFFSKIQTLYLPVDTTLGVNKKISATDNNQKNLVFHCNIFCSLYPVSSEVWHSDTWDICFTQKRQPRLHTHTVHTALQPSTLTSLCPGKLIPAEWHIFASEMNVVHTLVLRVPCIVPMFLCIIGSTYFSFIIPNQFPCITEHYSKLALR